MNDLISRQAAIDAVNNAFDRETVLTRFVRSIAVRAIRDMPSAQPQYEELTPVEVASEIASGSIMSARYWLDAMIRIEQMGYEICRKR